MKIAELFVALGFDVKGDRALHQVERNLMKAETAAVTLLAGVGALNVAFYAMMNASLQAVTSLEKFRVTTGLSSEELQRWQLAAKRSGIEGEEMIKVVTALQTAQKNVMLGQGDFSPFQFFGISVSQDPFAQLRTLHEKFQTMDPTFARIMAARLGISENLFQWLRRDNLELDKFNQELLLTNAQQKNIWNLNKAWQTFLFNLEALRNKFSETFAEPLANALRILNNFLIVAARFVEWLNGTSVAANITKTALIFLVAALTGLMVLLTGLTIALGMVALAVKIVALNLIPLAIAAAPIAIIIAAATIGLVTLALRLNDLWVSLEGGKSLYTMRENLVALVGAFFPLVNVIDMLANNWDRLTNAIKSAKSVMGVGTIAGALGMPGGSLFLPSALGAGAGGNTTVHQEHNTKIMIDGAQDPKTTAREVGDHLQRQVNQASGNLRPREY